MIQLVSLTLCSLLVGPPTLLTGIWILVGINTGIILNTLILYLIVDAPIWIIVGTAWIGIILLKVKIIIIGLGRLFGLFHPTPPLFTTLKYLQYCKKGNLPFEKFLSRRDTKLPLIKGSSSCFAWQAEYLDCSHCCHCYSLHHQYLHLGLGQDCWMLDLDPLHLTDPKKENSVFFLKCHWKWIAMHTKVKRKVPLQHQMSFFVFALFQLRSGYLSKYTINKIEN